MAVEAGWYSPTLLPGLDRHDLARSLYELFADEYGLLVDTADQTVRAEPADATVAHHLGVQPGDPVLAFDRLSRSGGAPLERVTSHYRGDRYELHVSLDRTMPEESSTPPEGNP
jgi:GntR family transcriptional regulator